MADLGHTESYIPGISSMDSSECAESDSTFSGPGMVSTHLMHYVKEKIFKILP